MQHKIIAGPCGNRFLRDAKAAERAVFLWTVNEIVWMKWCISKGVEGVITDDPETYLKVCKSYQGEKIRFTSKMWISVILWNIVARLFSLAIRTRFGFEINVGKRRGL